MTQPGITLLLIILVLLAITLWCIWWQWEYRNNAFIRAQKEIQRATGDQDRWKITRILMLGSDDDNRRLCRDWQLTDGAEYWFGQWWFNQQCALLCVPQTLQTPTAKHLLRQSDWQKTLAALVKSRPQRPLDALIITLPLEMLRDDEEPHPLRDNLLRNCQQIQQLCGLSLPIYLLIGGLEMLEGTEALLEMLPEEATQSPLGSSIPVARESVWRPQWIDEALYNTRDALRQVITELGALRGDVAPPLFRLPESFPSLAPTLHQLFDPLLNSNARDEPPLLRGIWFMARRFNDDKPSLAFCRKLLDRKIVAEKGLALPARRLLRLNLRRHFIILAGYCCIGVVWAAAMLYSWSYQHRNALLLHNNLLHLASQTAGGETAGERSAALYWRALSDIPQWQFSSLVWPGSFFSRTDGQLRETFRNATLANLIAPAANTLCLESQATLRGESARERDDILPEERYRQIERFLEQTQRTETHYLPLLQLLQLKRPGLQALAAFSSKVWRTEVDTADLPHPLALNRLFTTLNLSLLSLPDAVTLTQRNSDLFQRDVQLWLEQIYGNAQLDSYEGQLEQLLAQFSQSPTIDGWFVRTLVRQISRLQGALATINSLSHDAAHSPLAMQLNELLNKARARRLIRDGAVTGILSAEATLRQKLLAQMDNSTQPVSTLTERSAQGDFSVSPEILALQKSLRDLLNQPFWLQGTGSPPPAAVGYPGNGQLAQALALYGGYQRFMQQLPDSIWRPKIAALTRDAIESAMLQALYGDAPAAPQDSGVAAANADRAIEAFNQINRPALAVALRRQVAAQIIARVRGDGGALLPAGNAAPAINYASAEQAQASGQKAAAWSSARTEQISAAVAHNQEDIGWLDKQRPWMTAADNQLIGRWIDSRAAMQGMQQQDPASPPVRMRDLAAALPDFTAQNCRARLAEFSLPAGNDYYSQSLAAMLNEANQSCRQLRQQASIGMAQKIFNLYNSWLSGHFPFTALPQAPDADVDRVRELTSLLAQLPQEALADQPPLIQQLAAARPLLAELVSPQGVSVRVIWRTSRNKEQGAEQIADWRLTGNQQAVGWPGGPEGDLPWRAGDSLSFALRWAVNSPWRPLPGEPQPGLTVSGDAGRWRWQGNWALLRMIGGQREGGALTQPLSLSFTLPVGDGRQRARATVFLQLVLLDAEGKSPLPWVTLTEQGATGG